MLGCIARDTGSLRLTRLQDRRNSKRFEEMERVKGIEPSPQAWEAHVLPLNYTRSMRLCVSAPVDRCNAGVQTTPSAAFPHLDLPLPVQPNSPVP